MGHPMRLELARVGLLVKLANRYTTKGALFPLSYIFRERVSCGFVVIVSDGDIEVNEFEPQSRYCVSD